MVIPGGWRYRNIGKVNLKPKIKGIRNRLNHKLKKSKERKSKIKYKGRVSGITRGADQRCKCIYALENKRRGKMTRKYKDMKFLTRLRTEDDFASEVPRQPCIVHTTFCRN